MGMASRDQGDRPIRAAKTLLPASAACAQLHRGCTVSANCGQASRPRRGWACVKTGGKRSGESRSLSEASREGRWRKGGWRPAHRFALGEGRRWASRCPRGGNATDAVRPRDKGERDQGRHTASSGGALTPSGYPRHQAAIVASPRPSLCRQHQCPGRGHRP